MVTLTDRHLAEIIGKEIPNNTRIQWLNEDLPDLKIALRALRLIAMDDSFLVDATLPYWMYLAVLAALAPKKVLLNTPNFGPVLIPQNTPSGIGSGFTFKTYESEKFTLVQFLSPRTLQPEHFSSIIPPAVNPDKGVVIASSAPYWVIGIVGLAYVKAARWLASTQRSGAAVISMSTDKSIILGTEIDRQVLDDVIQKASKAAVPKRGEIWLFDDGYGQHPGLIISPTARNESSADVLIVPFTSSQAHAHRHLALAASKTGLSTGSFAQYSNISRLGREQLLHGPMSRVSEDVLNEIVRHVRIAISDVA